MKIDLHIHSNYSDGTDSIHELLNKIIASGINIFALTDHDTINGALAIQKIIPENITFIKGIEFSCQADNGTKCHILGFNYDENNQEFINALRTGENLRHEKFHKRIEILRDKFGIIFTQQEIENLSKIQSVGKPHLANLIVSKGLAENKQDAITRFINPCRTGNDKLNAGQAINAINSSNGLSIWAHPLGGEGEKELSHEKFFATLDELVSYGLKGIECFYSKYDYQTCQFLENTAKQKNLLISGGSDYHGKNKSIPLARLNADDIYIDSQKLTILKGVK